MSISPLSGERWRPSAWRREGAEEMLPQSGKKSQHVCVKGVKLCNEQYFMNVKSIVAQLFISLLHYC